MRRHLILLIVILLGTAGIGRCELIKDIVDIQGVRGNPLTGIGLLVGLAGTGDKTLASQQILTNIFRNSGLVLQPSDMLGHGRFRQAEIARGDREATELHHPGEDSHAGEGIR